jgi:outer membrane protein OmpA-like peptidoglycan-associated protein/tetratricopeptide (TPR) repeat protein
MQALKPNIIRLLCFVTLSFFISQTSVVAQNPGNKLANSGEKKKKRLNYSAALKDYKAALELEPTNKKALAGIVSIYLYSYEIFDTASIYIEKQISSFGPDTNYHVYYDYANCLRMQEKHEEAIEMYNFYKSYGLKRAIEYETILPKIDLNISYSINAMKNQELINEPFAVENMDFFINSLDDEYTPVYLENDDLLMYNARYKDYGSEFRDVDNQYFENIYYFNLEESVASTYNPSIDQSTHQCIVGRVYDSDTILVFFKNRVWISSMTEHRLNTLEPLPSAFGGFYYQPHGVFSKDQKTFIFSARSEFGNLDIYQSIKLDTTWTKPKPISIKINSSKDEDSPYLSEDGKTLYFSSKGHNSSGGYDVFKSTLGGSGWSIPENLGYPINSAGDDIYLEWNNDERGGYFSSNRNGGFGGMDIYAFGLTMKTIKGTVKDHDSLLLAGVEVVLTDKELGIIGTVTTDESGEYSFVVDYDRKLDLTGTKEGYFQDNNSIETFGEEEVIISNLVLEKDPGISLYLLAVDSETREPLDSVYITYVDNMTDIKDSLVTPQSGDDYIPLPEKKLNDRGSYNFILKRRGYLTLTATYNVLFDHEGVYNVLEELGLVMEKVEVGLDLTKIIDINPIYFDYNRYVIRPDAAIELDKIVQVMNDNPNMRIELGSHTDSRGSAKANQKLSDRRAKASAEYIKKKITNPERITGKGYGESKLVNHCSDGVKCTEVEHQENRRTEFIILEM